MDALQKRIEALEKKMADLERQLQEQPQGNSFSENNVRKLIGQALDNVEIATKHNDYDVANEFAELAKKLFTLL